jgi:chorismate dehydratase
LAASSYLNSAPLIWSFLQGSRRNTVELIDQVPAKCAQMLAKAEVDVALVPIIEFQRLAGVSVVPGVCVGSRKEVRSVVLVSKSDDLSSIRKVALDESSRTSATLVKIIFREFVHSEPLWSNHSPDLKEMLETNDAALIIGDPAMTIQRNQFKVWDLATLWRNDAFDAVNQIDFQSARDEGVAHIEEIVSDYAKRIPLTRDELLGYLTKNISFEMDKSMSAGLRLYYELAAKHHLIDRVKPLEFFPGR